MQAYIEELAQKLSGLTTRHQTAFAAAIADELLPLYLSCEGYEWCNPKLYKHILQQVLIHSEGRIVLSDDAVYAFEQELLRWSPNLEECSEFDALDAASAIGFALRSCLSTASSLVAASAAEVALDNRVKNSTNKDDAIQKEIIKQKTLLRYLQIIESVDEKAIDELRKLAKSNEI